MNYLNNNFPFAFLKVNVEVSKLRELPVKLRQIPPLVVPVTLSGSYRFTVLSAREFCSLVLNKELEMTVVGKENYQTCMLTSLEGDILNALSERMASSAYGHEQLIAGQKCMVQIVSLRPSREIWSFYVRLATNNQMLDALHERVSCIDCRTIVPTDYCSEA